MAAKYLKNEQQKRKAEQVISMLEYKVRQGTATPEEVERHRVGVTDLCIYDWGQPAYQDYIPNLIAEAERRKAERKAKPRKQKAMPKPPVVGEGVVARPPLPRRRGKFGVA